MTNSNYVTVENVTLESPIEEAGEALAAQLDRSEAAQLKLQAGEKCASQKLWYRTAHATTCHHA